MTCRGRVAFAPTYFVRSIVSLLASRSRTGGSPDDETSTDARGTLRIGCARPTETTGVRRQR